MTLSLITAACNYDFLSPTPRAVYSLYSASCTKQNGLLVIVQCNVQSKSRSAKWIGGDRRLGVSRDAHCLGAETACGLGGREGPKVIRNWSDRHNAGQKCTELCNDLCNVLRLCF